VALLAVVFFQNDCNFVILGDITEKCHRKRTETILHCVAKNNVVSYICNNLVNC